MLTFIKYPDIENSYRQKHIDYFVELHPELATAIFVLQEKIHGCNIQLIFGSDGSVSVGSRTQVIAWEDKTALYGIVSFLESSEDLKKLISAFSAKAVFDASEIRLYGEFFGAGIQKGVDYGKEKRILFFDMSVNSELYPAREMINVFSKMNISNFIVPDINLVSGLGSAIAHADIAIKSNSRLGPELEDDSNWMEGCVIKPLDRVFLDGNGDPFMLKVKNESFSEKQKAPKPAPKEVSDPAIANLRSIFVGYLNENRLESLFSKMGEISDPSQLGDYIKAFMNDAIADFMKDEGDRMSVLSKQDQKIVLNASKIAVEMLKKKL